MPLPYPSMNFTAFDILTAAEMNQLVANIESLQDWSAYTAGSLPASLLSSGAVGPGPLLIKEVTLGTAGDTISLTSIPARNHLRVVVYVAATGGTVSVNLRFNNDSGTNYADRISVNGGADATGGSGTSAVIAGASAYNSLIFDGDIHNNIAAKEKTMVGFRTDANATGGANVPSRAEFVTKWANTSAQINRVDVLNLSGTGDFAIGSQVQVFGW